MMQTARDTTYRVLGIVRGTTVDGPGFRTAIYLAGCPHGCPGCHNPGSHDPRGGETMTLSEIMAVVTEEDFDVTLTGGDPLMHPTAIIPLMRAIRATGHRIWLYTGYTWEQIVSTPRLLSAASLADVIVDGPFIRSMRDPDLLFRGSRNQRLVDVARTLATGHPTAPEPSAPQAPDPLTRTQNTPISPS